MHPKGQARRGEVEGGHPKGQARRGEGGGAF